MSFEQIFSFSNLNDHATVQNLNATLSELAVLGDNRSGRFSVLLSSSSAFVPSFIANHKQEIPDLNQYPVFKVQGTNMNSTKFNISRIRTQPPTSLDGAHQMFPGCDIVKAKLITFIAGNTPGEIQRWTSVGSKAEIVAKLNETAVELQKICAKYAALTKWKVLVSTHAQIVAKEYGIV